MGKRDGESHTSDRAESREPRWHFGRWLALATIVIGGWVSLLPVTPTGYYDFNCGSAFQAALSKPGDTSGPSPTRGQLCHPLGTARLVDVMWIVAIGLLASLVIGHFAQPPKD